MICLVNLMVYKIKVTHTAPTFEQFAEWGVQQAWPTFYLNITFNDEEKEVLLFKIRIQGHYYCSGSRNFEDIEMELDSYEINDNISDEEVSELLGGDNIKQILEESITDSMIPNDSIGILELLWDKF